MPDYCGVEVKPGYKQTEVGVIPEEWDVVALGSLTTLVASGKSRSGVGQGTYPVHGSTGIIGYTERPEYEGDSILAARVGANAGKLNLVSGKYGVTDNTIMLQLRGGYSLPFFWLQLETKRLNNLVFGSGQPLITGSQLKTVFLSVPPLPEQRAIAEALSDVDGLLSGLDRLIAKKRNLKQAAMQQLLTGQTRLPGFHGEWEVKRLGDVGKLIKGSGVTKDQTRTGSLACVRYGELYTHHNDVIRGFHSWISPKVAETAVQLEHGDILFAGSGETKEEIGKCAAFVSDIKAFAGGDIVILRPTDSNSEFLGYYLNTSPIVRQKASRGQGDAVVHISSAGLADVRCTLPPRFEQTAIASVLTAMDEELAGLEQHRAKSAAIKQGMMQELLSGRIRLRQPEALHA